MRSTIVLVNDRPEGGAALRWGADHARRCGNDLQVVLVPPTPRRPPSTAFRRSASG